MNKLPTIDLPAELAAQAADAAQAAGESLAAFVARAVSSQIERERTEAFFADRRARADLAKALGILDRDGGVPPQPGDDPPPRASR